MIPYNKLRVLRYMVFGFILVHLVVAWWSNNLVHQLGSPVLVTPRVDNLYWMYHILGLPQLITSGHLVAIAFDLLLLVSVVLAMVKGNRIYALCVLVLYSIYYVTFNSFAGHHYHSTIGIMLAVVPLCLKGRAMVDGFGLVRYYVCFVFVSAVLWKGSRFALINPEQMDVILQIQNISLLVQQPQHWRSELVMMIVGGGAASIFLWVGAALQASWLVGFFTRRYDVLLFVAAVLFHLGTWILMGISFWEFWIVYITLLPWFGTSVPKENVHSPADAVAV